MGWRHPKDFFVAREGAKALRPNEQRQGQAKRREFWNFVGVELGWNVEQQTTNSHTQTQTKARERKEDI